MLRANQIARTEPRGPVYLCLDAGLQETEIEALPTLPDPARYAPPEPPRAGPDLIADAARRLAKARHPVILMGRVGRSQEDWDRRVRLAERLGALVLTDLKAAAAFPSGHRLLGAHASTLPSPAAVTVLTQADVILSLDWIDLAGTLKAAFGAEPAPATVIAASMDHHLHNGWSMDHQGLAPADINLAAGTDMVVADLLTALGDGEPDTAQWRHSGPAQINDPPDPDGRITVPDLAAAIQDGLAGRDSTLVRGTFSWSGHLWRIAEPLDYLGIDGGAGLGSGTGIAVGAALALKDSGRVVLSVFGDGDFLMGCQAIWTACHYRIPLIVFVANNHSFFNDELHQERMARQRGRLVENKWIGQRIADPEIDIAMMARAQGATGIGPVKTADDLAAAVKAAVETFDRGGVAVVDVRVKPGYDANTTRLTTMGDVKSPAPDENRKAGDHG
jgi:thiamine pyrophosphate-dependent acetolactate synthase large subunit-like protein